MRVLLSLLLPREVISIPLARRVLAAAMRLVGVADDCAGDIKVALSEACTNVVNHAVDGDEYEVVCAVDDDKCVIDVIDRGHGFDSTKTIRAHSSLDAEAGRGIQLMRRLVDRVRFESRPKGGTVVHLEKALRWQEGAPLHG